MRLPIAALALAACALTACAQTPPPQSAAAQPSHPEGALYDPSLAAKPAVDAALARAGERGTKVLVALGGNWCGDSRALASHFLDPRFADLIEREFELVYVNVGMPQTGDGHNLDVAERFGVTIEGTPTLLVLDAGGTLLNTPEDAIGWRNAATRSADDIYAALEGWASGAAGA